MFFSLSPTSLSISFCLSLHLFLSLALSLVVSHQHENTDKMSVEWLCILSSVLNTSLNSILSYVFSRRGFFALGEAVPGLVSWRDRPVMCVYRAAWLIPSKVKPSTASCRVTFSAHDSPTMITDPNDVKWQSSACSSESFFLPTGAVSVSLGCCLLPYYVKR